MEYLLDNARRMELLEETPTVPSGRCSDMTDVEKDKLIDLLFARNESLENKLVRLQATLERQGDKTVDQMNALRSQLQRMEERAVAAERRAEAAERRNADLTAALTGMMDGTVIKDLKERIAKAEKERDDAKASDRQNRSERYGSTSRKVKKSRKPDGSGDDGNDRDAGEDSDILLPEGLSQL